MTVEQVLTALETFCTDKCSPGKSFAPNFADFFLRHIDAPQGLRANVITKLVSLGHCHPDRRSMFIALDPNKGVAIHPVTGKPVP